MFYGFPVILYELTDFFCFWNTSSHRKPLDRGLNMEFKCEPWSFSRLIDKCLFKYNIRLKSIQQIYTKNNSNTNTQAINHMSVPKKLENILCLKLRTE